MRESEAQSEPLSLSPPLVLTVWVTCGRSLINLQSTMAPTACLPSKSCVKSSYAQPYPGTIWIRELWGGDSVELNETRVCVSLIFFFTYRDKRAFPLMAPVRVASSLLSGGWGESDSGWETSWGTNPCRGWFGHSGAQPSWDRWFRGS